MKTYNAIKIRMRSRFTKNGILASKLFIVSSKKSEMDFIESYVQTIKDSPNVIISDEPQWNVKPPGTFSNKRFKVAVGNKKVKSKIVSKDDDIKSLKKQGYDIIDVPLELYADFNRDIDRALMDLAGISSNIVSKFISYENLHRAHCNRQNPFSNTVISLGTLDNLEIMEFFDPSIVPEEIYTKPIFIHLDMSLTGDRTGIGAVAVMGLREDMAYVEGEVVPVQEMVYAHVFSVGIQCPAGAQISLEKNRRFIYYLKYNLGWNIKGLSADGFQSADTLQQFNQAGFDARLVSLDKSPNGYLYLKASINEKRVSMLDIDELNNEIINLEQNNQTGKVDHPLNGSKDISDGMCLSYDTKIFLLSGRELTIEELYNSNYSDEYILACDIDSQKLIPVKIQNVIKKKFVPEFLYKITLDNGESFKVTEDHLILMRDGSYKEARSLVINDSLMPFNFYSTKNWKNYYRQVVNPFNQKSEFLYKLVVHELKQEEFDSVVLNESNKYVVIHHIDHNKFNDLPSNLQPMGNADHRKLHGEIFTAYNKSKKKRLRTSELCKAGISGFNSVDEQKMLQIRKNNGHSQIIKYNKSEKHKLEAAERGKTSIYNVLKYAHTKEANEKRKKTREVKGYNKHFSEKVSQWNSNEIVKHNQALGKIRKAYEAVKTNSNLFDNDVVTYEQFLDEVRRLKDEGIIKKRSTFKQDYNLIVEAGVPITNHRIVSIEIIPNNKYVYDIQLDKIHNFAINAGIFVHNCGALYNASQMVDRSSLYIIEDYQSISDTNDFEPSSSLGEAVITDMSKELMNESIQDRMNSRDIDNELSLLQTESDKASVEADKKRIARIKSMISQSDKHFISDDEIEDSYFNKESSDMLIW